MEGEAAAGESGDWVGEFGGVRVFVLGVLRLR